MAKILFIEKRIRNEKMGIMYLSAILKQRGHQTELVQTEIENIDDVIKRFNPDFFAYSICTGEHRFALNLNSELKKKYPDKKSIFGGPHPTFFPEIADEQGVDYVVIGQGEKAIVDIVEGKAKEKVVRCSLVENINSLPLPDRDIIYKYDEFGKNPMKNIITLRDCPYSCTYCYNHSWRNLFKDEANKMFQRKSIDYVIKEINEVKNKYPLEKVLFLDDNFVAVYKGNEKWLDEFCRRWKNEVGLPFLCSMRVNLIDEDLIKRLKEAGLEMVNFALESADPYVQQEVLNRGQITNDDIERAIKLFRKYNIRCRMQNMLGLPVKDPLKDALNTLQFNIKNRVDDSWASIYQPYPRTRLGEYCLEHGFVKGDLLEACADSFFDESRLDIPDKDKIQRLQKWWYFIIEFNIPPEFVKILLDIPLNKEVMEKMQKVRYEFTRKKLYGLGEKK